MRLPGMFKKAYIIFAGRFPSETAGALFAAREAASCAALGIETTIVVPRRIGRLNVDAHTFFDVPRNVHIAYLPTLDVFKIPIVRKLAFPIHYLSFSIACLVYFLHNRTGFVISNETVPLLVVSLVRKSLVFEVHNFPERNRLLYRMLFARMSLCVATNSWKYRELLRRFPETNVLLEQNAVDAALLKGARGGDERQVLGMGSKKTVLYTGHLYPWKGADVLARAAHHIPEAQFVFLGGTEGDVAAFRTKYTASNISIRGHIPHADIARWQRAADVLVLPNTREAISSHYTSPMKLFEYMASGTPIVASDLPATREMVSEKEAVLVEPEDEQALARGIQNVLEHPAESEKRSIAARERVADHTWEKRMRRILDALETK